MGRDCFPCINSAMLWLRIMPLILMQIQWKRDYICNQNLYKGCWNKTTHFSPSTSTSCAGKRKDATQLRKPLTSSESKRSLFPHNTPQLPSTFSSLPVSHILSPRPIQFFAQLHLIQSELGHRRGLAEGFLDHTLVQVSQRNGRISQEPTNIKT